jgi:hypothetical protein
VTAFVDYAREQMKAGASVDDAAAGFKTAAQFKGYETGPLGRMKSNIQVIYNELGN